MNILKEFGIDELWDKYVRCSYSRADGGVSSVRIIFRKEVWLYVGD